MRQKDIGQEARERKYRELELQFKELELVNRRNNEELAQLRTIKDLHSKCELTINELKTTVKMQARKL